MNLFWPRVSWSSAITSCANFEMKVATTAHQMQKTKFTFFAFFAHNSYVTSHIACHATLRLLLSLSSSQRGRNQSGITLSSMLALRMAVCQVNTTWFRLWRPIPKETQTQLLRTRAWTRRINRMFYYTSQFERRLHHLHMFTTGHFCDTNEEFDLSMDPNAPPHCNMHAFMWSALENVCPNVSRCVHCTLPFRAMNAAANTWRWRQYFFHLPFDELSDGRIATSALMENPNEMCVHDRRTNEANASFNVCCCSFDLRVSVHVI